ncbi:MAG: integral membrane sensor signal transduction histidine kinase [Candidatus Berkelbacteria bacterium Licking1014_96]|uniref:Integral membrane sensor signal transduction histidine kinase n=1 Tax=Candidatus Berkelbacteria bacterium Licking1014_96 TaxID=2017149 RepID=A0A554LFU0_9BACT|nr:MAG: integral membrane sensor signal transduction histidine kinase [Candidatus Berkelbacteria bacterium Licking1014_96]
MKKKLKPEDKLVIRYSEFKLVFLSVILLFFIVFPYLLPARINIQENIVFVVAVLTAWLFSAIIYLIIHLRKWRANYSFLRYAAVIADILFLSVALFVLSGINSNYFFIFVFVIIGASFYLDLNLIFCAGILSAAIIFISFFIEGQNSTGHSAYLLMAVRLVFILASTYFVYLFVLSYKEISRQKAKIKNFSLLNQELLNHFSNQLRAPLPVIRDFMEVLFLEKAGPLNAKQKKILSMLHDNTKALIEESSNVVYYNQLRLGEFYLKKERADLVSLIEAVIKRNVNESLNREVEVVYTTRQKEIIAEVDQIKLSSAINTILARIIILAKQNSIIRIFSRSSRYSHYVKITLKYNGEALPQIEKISRENLDIYVADKIITLHHGNLNIISEEEKQKIEIILPS